MFPVETGCIEDDDDKCIEDSNDEYIENGYKDEDG